MITYMYLTSCQMMHKLFPLSSRIYLTVISSDGHMHMYANTLKITLEKYLRPNAGVFVDDAVFQ